MYLSNLNVVDAIDCNLNGQCDGHFLGSEVTSDISDCIYFCRETKVNQFQKSNNLIYSFKVLKCKIFRYLKKQAVYW